MQNIAGGGRKSGEEMGVKGDRGNRDGGKDSTTLQESGKVT